ncbi:IAP-3 [Spodoptera eridania nucleopolyhedrovirus]|uniref:IAP-3 n=1 Tax=Spodoptera eridania nucleopolyhedrovirus TaxID=2315721 RepID=A0A346TQ48_9ABAC|nr:IAP-3 [Spodoptera eridania nucleopolyhedrovirus]AXU41708.1 IAP-3 [Spodoptera eridania nucleopolyhedrovirus]
MEYESSPTFQERLNSFAEWPTWAQVSPFHLALSGFYYIGRGDEVRCAFCKVEIMNWKRGDDPLVDHKRWAPQCAFARNVCSISTIAKTIAYGEDGGASNETPSTSSKDVCGTGDTMVPKPKHEAYAEYKDRLATYTNWPRDINQSPQDLANAGFFYTGRNAEVRCFQSDCGLSDWEPTDDPWREHARWFPRCQYVISVKGKDYVQESVSQACVIKETAAAATRTPRLSSSSSNNEEDEKMCKICFDRPRNMCFVPCGHVIACEKCALIIKNCPMCRNRFTHTQKLFFV